MEAILPRYVKKLILGIQLGAHPDFCKRCISKTRKSAESGHPAPRATPRQHPCIPFPRIEIAIGIAIAIMVANTDPPLEIDVGGTGNALPVPPAPADILDRCTHPASRPNPIFCPSIPIPIPTPTPIIIPTAIGTHLSCIENMSKHQGWAPPTSVAQQQATMVGDKREYRCRQDDCEI
jgi:hypothetical protein